MKLIDIKWKTHNKTVMIVAPFFNFTKDENCIIRPLKEAHKRQGTYWEKAYQAVKHDRYSSLHKGNVRAFIQALAALYLLNIYYRNDSWITKYQDIQKMNYSLGSSIFTVNPPSVNQLWNENSPIISESPYVVSYQENEYRRIKEMQSQEERALNDYWREQPELNDPAFQTQLQEAIEKEKNDPSQRVMHIWELAKYRLNKKIPDTLTFEERKRRLISSEEWNGWINQNNAHLSMDELTEDNIQKAIDLAGIRCGMEMMKKIQKIEWLPYALNGDICNIYIPDNKCGLNI